MGPEREREREVLFICICEILEVKANLLDLI